jgi:ATP-dependent helicase/DNAse subunit B
MFCNQISNSKRDLWRQCRLKYRYKYVDYLEETDKGNMDALQFGSYIHEIFEQGVECTDLEGLQKIAAELRGTYKFAKSYEPKIETCLKNFLRLNSSFPEKGQVELSYKQDIGCTKWPLEQVGFVDRIIKGKDGGILVIDYKTGRREKTKFDLFEDSQGMSYVYAAHKIYGVPVDKITFAHYYPLTDNLVTVKYTPAALTKHNKRIVEDAWNIRKAKKEDLTASENEFCNWCGYKSLCPIFNPTQLVEERLQNATKRPKRKS